MSAFQGFRFDIVDLHCSLCGHALPLEQPRKGAPGLNLKPAASICRCLDWGDAEILRQRKT